MFNPLRADQMILAVGGVLRLAADARGPLDEYQRSQALSAYSVTRNYAAELAASGELLSWLQGELLPALAEDDRRSAARAHERLAIAADGVEVGEVLGDLLEELRRDGRDPDALRRKVQSVLADLADREIEALARGAR